MKSLFAISFLLLFLFSTQAQENSLIEENRVWSSLQDNCAPDIINYISFHNRVKGDTLLNGKIYKKVQIADDENAEQWSYTNEYLREENNRVYYLGDLLDEEFLIYDFNVKAGDEVTVWNPLEPDGLTLQVINIDSVLTFDGYRKRLELILNEFSSSEFWIEGIGSEYGLLNSGGGVFLGICGNYFLLCSSENNVQVYQNPAYQTCYFSVLGQQENDLNETEIVYKSSTKKLYINLQENESVKVMITNISGFVMLKTEASYFEQGIDFSTFSSGLYIVSLIGKNSVLSKKVYVN